MKKYIYLLLIVFSSNISNAQDIIMKRNNDELKAKIIEITDENIKYKDFDYQDGPTRNIKVSEVFMILYENGKREKFNVTQSQTQEEAVEDVISKNEIPENKVVTNESPKSDYDGKYFMLAIGYGNSYGGSGLRAQWRFGGIQGFGFHIGGGYLPDADVFLAAAGIKYFPYKNLYINAQFGLIGNEEYYESYSDGYNYYSNYDENLLYGPSVLLGGDWNWGGRVGFGFNAGLGASYALNTEYYDEIMLAIDLGFVIRF